jgi:hypothetical protein
MHNGNIHSSKNMTIFRVSFKPELVYMIIVTLENNNTKIHAIECVSHMRDIKGHFTPRGRTNLLCKRLENLTCDWPKASNRFQPLYT